MPPVDPITSPSRPRRGLIDAFRRRPLLWLAIFCVVASAVLLAAPYLQRTYAIDAALRLTVHTFGAIPEVERAPDVAAARVREYAGGQGVHIEVSGTESEHSGDGGAVVRTVLFHAAGPSHDAADVAVRTVAQRFSADVADAGRAAVSAYESQLQKQVGDLDTQQAAINRELDAFRVAHRGAMPDDPDSILKKYDKLNTQLDDRQERLRLVTEQIARLEEYRKGGRPLPSAGGAAATQAGGGGLPVEPAVAAAGGGDPEVITLAAQLQLVNSQIDEQLNKFHRTEQHPYVVDLRTQQADLQKKLAAAQARAAAGQPAPANITLPNASGSGSGETNAATVQAQAVDIQLTQLRAEKDEIGSYIKTLTEQRAGMQAQVDSLGPVRRQYDALQGRLADNAKARAAAAAQLEAAQRQYPGADDAAGSVPPVEVGAVQVAAGSDLPVWPRLWEVCGAALLAGLAAAVAAVLLAAAGERSLRTTQEAAAVLDLPILATVPVIRTPAGRRWRTVWRTVVRPAWAVALIGVLGVSAYLSWRHLRQPGFGSGDGHGVAQLLSFAGARR